MRKNTHKRRSIVVEEPVADINTTPLIDVMLVLLIMLIITIPVQLHAVKLNLPQGNPPHSEQKPEVVLIDINAASQVLWNGEVLADSAQLKQHMVQAVAQATPPEVHLRPDRHAAYNVVAGVLAQAQRQGLSKIGIVGSEQFAL